MENSKELKAKISEIEQNLNKIFKNQIEPQESVLRLMLKLHILLIEYQELQDAVKSNAA